MYSIDYLVSEHKEIKKVIKRIEDECLEIISGNEIDNEFFRAAIEFIRKYADATHHKKEEDILFKYMTSELGALADKLIKSGMLIEHQMARYHVMELENNLNLYLDEKSNLAKLQIITHAMSYVNLLRLHIDKEDNVVYPFGEKSLSDEIKEKIEVETKAFIETEKDNKEDKEKLLKVLFN